MHCPQCATTRLVIAERAGVEIDYCPRCRGVWLERAELDKVLARAAREGDPEQVAHAERSPAARDRRRQSWLAAILD